MVKGVILAAGKGTRMRPITYEIPKVMLPVGGIPVFEHIVNLMKKHGITDIMYNCYKKSLPVHYMEYKEHKLWGTAGAIKRMADSLNETFVLIYGDVLTKANLTKMIKFHRKKGGLGVLGVTRVPHPEVKGIVETDKNNRIVSFEEKPTHPKSNLANSAVYIFEPEILKHIPKNRFYDIGHDLLPKIIHSEKLYAYHIKEFLIDIGDFESYEKAIMRYKK